MEYINAKHIVTKTKDSRWFGCDFNMNIYRGCCHGCIYCDSRSDCYGIKKFDVVKVKKDALNILRDDLRRKVKKGVICTGSMSDPYNTFERELMLTRNSLELINNYGYGVGIATKSPLITRDIDILKDINEHSPVIAKITITAPDEISKRIEPNVALSSARFEAVKKLTENGIFTGILLMPVLPFITDMEDNIKNIVKLAHESRADFIYAAFGVTLRDRQREYFYDNLDELYPNYKAKYIKTYKNSYRCVSKNVKKLWEVFTTECERYGILYNMKGIVQAFKYEHKGRQITVFD